MGGLAGVAAAALYPIATALGSVLDPAYSQLDRHVSDLTGSGAPTRAALAPAYLLYDALTLAFALGLYLSSDRSRLQQIGLAMLLLNGLAGVAMVTPFPADLGGPPTTFAGRAHVAFAGISSLSIVVASFVYGVAFRRAPGWRSLSAFSLGAGVAFLVLGPLAVVATARGTLAGLAERGPIGVFVVWLLVVGERLARRPPPRD